MALAALLALAGLPGSAPAAPMDPKQTDETFIRRQFERSQAQALETMRIREEKRKEFLDRSRIGEAGDSCLAYAIGTGECSISAAEFDRGLASHIPDSLEFQPGESLASKAAQARRSVFEHLVDRAFLDAYRMEDSPRYPASDARKIREEGRGFYDGYDLPTLLDAFPRIRAQVIAASDSAWLAARLRDARSGLLPATLPARELPDSVLALLARYPRGEWTPIRKVPFGFLACSWLDSLPASETLARIRPRLDRSGWKSRGQGRSQAIDSLRRHKEWCLEEDTLRVSLRLVPPLRGRPQAPEPAWMNANSAVLPASVKSWLWVKFDHGALDTVGPIRSVYGNWMLALSSRDIGPGRTLDSAACLARIEAKFRQEDYAERIRSEWETVNSKADCDRNGDARTALLENLSKEGPQPETSYRRMRERWVSRSLRFTRDLGFLDASPGSGSGKTE